MQSDFRNINLHSCPYCDSVLIVPIFGGQTVTIHPCPDCDEMVMVFNKRTYKIDKNLIIKIDIEKLQQEIFHILRAELARSDFRHSPMDFGRIERDLFVYMDAEDESDGECEEDEWEYVDQIPISKDEIKLFRQYLKSYKIPWSGNRL